MATSTRPRKPSTGLRGVTNLAVLAPVRDRLVHGFEPVSYVERLKKVLAALQSARQNLRESELLPSFFVDTIGRLDIIHHFRYALVQPQAPGEPWRLSLNVTFDGGWEPYMRVIYRDIGPLLDLLFCHNDTYPGSRAPFEQYCDWVRENEVEAGFFYSESAVTLQDQRYLLEVEKAQRERNGCDRELARLALAPAAAAREEALARAQADPLHSLVLPLRTLKGLYRLTAYFPSKPLVPGTTDDATILRRFTRSVLAEAIEVMEALDDPHHPSTDPAWQQARTLFRDELAWLRQGREDEGARPEAEPPCDPAKLQSHILGRQDDKVTHGCLVLLRIKDPEAAAATLKDLADKCDPAKPSEVRHLVALTYAGLQELGIPKSQLDAFPQEFYEGMEARHALLGDLRGNHPDHWVRPPLEGRGNHRVDMKVVHVAIQMRFDGDAADAGAGLHAKFGPCLDDLRKPKSGLRVLAVEPLRTYRTGEYASGHLRVADGLSQPWISTKGSAEEDKKKRAEDRVSTGELLLGYRNDRGDQPQSTGSLLQDGSFLVVRKLRQRMDHLEAALRQVDPRQRDEVLAKMVGRRRDGTPLAAPGNKPADNNFAYADQAASDACPFHSHIRRANPRDGRPYTPRILRRGMSYGPLPTPTTLALDRGVMFMAYCASIAEQFETVQRWVAGGNSSGVGSAQADPLLRVPQHGESHTFRFLDGANQPMRVTFEARPLVELQWGLYLFVPSLAALRALPELRDRTPVSSVAPCPHAQAAQRPAPPAPQDDALERERQVLEDPQKSACVWAGIRAGGDEHRNTVYGRLVGTHDEIVAIMCDPGTRYSVEGYGKRMAESVGMNFLGMDDSPQRQALAALIKPILDKIGEEEAFALTLPVVEKVLAGFPPVPPASQQDIVRKPIDLLNFSDQVLAALGARLFGPPPTVLEPGGRPPEGDPSSPRCPGNFLSASRFIFSTHPHQDVEETGKRQGAAALQAVREWVRATPFEQLPARVQEIFKGLPEALPGPQRQEILALTVSGILLGFAPTVQGNFLRVMSKWIECDPGLWELQQDLLETWQGDTLSYATAKEALRQRILDTMRTDPAPSTLWRLDKHPEEKQHNPVVLGIASAMAVPGTSHLLMFGRNHEELSRNGTLHGCPGYGMAMGVLVGMAAGLMKAGTLRPTGSPVLLMLTPNT